MTRETKIGLLVGLAFIIVIGILLSDHIQTAAEPPRAPLTHAADVVSSSVNTPGHAGQPAVIITAPQNLQPSETVPTTEDLDRNANAQTIVRIGQQPVEEALPITVNVRPERVIVQPDAVQNVPQRQPEVTEVAGADVPDAVYELARKNGEELVAVGNAAATMKSYTAQTGDTLSKMALRFLGANTKANRLAIINANPSLRANPDKIIAGKMYVIPVIAAAPAPAPLIVETASPAPALKISGQPEYIYTVKAGDNLTRIAENQLGDARAINAILELNKDVLKDANKIFEGMKLRLPAKPVASVE